MDLLPDAPAPRAVDRRFADHGERELHLRRRARGLAVDVERVAGEVAHEDVEDLVDGVGVDCLGAVEGCILEDQLGVDDEGEELADGEQEIDILGLLIARRGAREEGAEGVDLLTEEVDVRQVPGGKGGGEVVEANLAEATRRPLVPEEGVVGRVVAPRNRRQVSR